MRITPLGPVAAATCAFRAGGRLWVTAVVKATFAMVPDAPMTLAAPAPVVRADETYGGRPDRSLSAAAEAAPSLSRAEVFVRGRAAAPMRRPAPRLGVRVMIARDGQPLIDKRLVIQGPREATGRIMPILSQPLVYEYALGGPDHPDNPVGTHNPARLRIFDPQDPRRPGGLGPIARAWPVRRRLLGGMDPRRLEGPLIDLPDGFPWAYFQAAPPDQRISPLRGDEWIILEGFHAEIPRLQSCLPSARAAARLYGPTPDLSAGVPAQMTADMLLVDTEQRTCAVVWRGRFPAASEQALPALEIAADIELAGRVPVFPPSARVLAEAPLGTTADVPPSAPARAARPLPFQPSRPAAGPPDGGVSRKKWATMAMPAVEERASAPALPFQRDAAPAPPPARAAGDDLLASTVALDPQEVLRRLREPAIPFAGAPRAAPPRSDRPLPAATPFDRPSAPPPPLHEPPRVQPPPLHEPPRVQPPPLHEPPRVQPPPLHEPARGPSPPLQPPALVHPSLPATGVLPASAQHRAPSPEVREDPFVPPPPPEVVYADPDAPPPEAPARGPLGASFLLGLTGAGAPPASAPVRRS